MVDSTRSEYESPELRDVRPYLIAGDADALIRFLVTVFAAVELERHRTPAGGVAHAKVRIGHTIVEIGEHPDASDRPAEPMPRVGLRLYVQDVDATHRAALEAGATGTEPVDRLPGVRSATVFDPFGFTWWLASPTQGAR